MAPKSRYRKNKKNIHSMREVFENNAFLELIRELNSIVEKGPNFYP